MSPMIHIFKKDVRGLIGDFEFTDVRLTEGPNTRLGGQIWRRKR